MNPREFVNGKNQDEPLDAESMRVVELLSALPRVEAPANFEFGVKARMAARRSTPRSGMLPFLKIAAPLCLVLIVAGFVLFFGSYPDSSGTDVVVSPPNALATEPATPRQDEIRQTAAASEVAGPSSAEPAEPAVSAQRTAPPFSRHANKDQGRRPLDFTQRSVNVIMPPGTESANPRNRNMNSTTSSDAPVNDLLEIWGIKAEFADSGWKVGSVVENSVGARSGVRANDVIESINSQPLKKDTKIKTEGVRTVHVSRDGKQVTLSIQN